MAHAKTSSISGSFNRRRLVVLAIGLLFLYVLLPQVGKFTASWRLLEQASVAWVAVGITGVGMSYLFAAATYCLLVRRRLRYWPTVLVEIAGLFTNRLLPAGLGTIGMNYAYLRRQKQAVSEAASVVALNNLLGFVGHGLLLCAVLASGVSKWHVGQPTLHQFMTGLGVLAVLAAVGLVVMRLKRQTGRLLLRQVGRNLLGYRRRPGKLSLALASSVLLSVSYALVLYAAARAVGVMVSLPDIFVVLSLSVAGTIVLPTPGGLGGAEAGIVAGLLLFGISDAQALAAALLYRLLTYWLALLVGFAGFVTVQKLGYV